MKKISISLFIILLITGFSFAQKSQKSASELYSKVSYKLVLKGDMYQSVCENCVLPNINEILKNQRQVKSPQYNVAYTFTGCTTIWDNLTNGVITNIIQDQNYPDRIHFIGTSCLSEQIENQRAKYYYSTNRGQSWTFISNVVDIRIGMPTICLASNGNALISGHTSYGGGNTRAQWFYDIAPGLGSFTNLDHPTKKALIWTRTVTTNNITQTNKFVTIASTSGDSAFRVIGNSFAGNLFSSWQYFPAATAERYSIARGSDGRIGIAYIVNYSLYPSDCGSAYFIESTDNGTTFSSPIKIFSANLSQTGDSLAPYYSIQIVYQENVPKVVFDIFKQSFSGGNSSYYPNDGRNHIRFWSSNLPGTDPNRSIIIADTSLVGYHFLMGGGGYSIMCRPVIGTSSDGTGLFVGFMVPSNYVGGSVDTVSFMDVWFTYSLNYGLNWIPPSKITHEFPIRDWTYPSMSPVSDYDANNYYANFMIISDSLPGTYFSHQLNGPSVAKYMFTRVEIPKSLPSAPVLLSPPNGSQNQSRNPNMKWYPVTGAATYRLQFALDQLFTTPIFDSANIIQTNLQLPQNFLSPGINIYWRVNATNSSGSGPWSNIWSFKTDTTPFYSVSGTIRYKDNNQLVIGGYIKIMKVNPSNLVITTFDSVLVQSNGTYLFPTIRKDADYYISPYPNSTPPNDNFVPTYYPSEILWERATPVNVNSNLTNIDIYVYRTMDTIGYHSINGQVFKNSSPNNPINDVIVYAKKDANFHKFSITNIYGQYSLNNLLEATYKLYFCRLGYRSDSINVTLLSSQYLNSVNFSMIPFYTGIENNGNVIPTSYKLYQNYPNPFNPITKIKFDLPKSSDVLLRIYDVSGREIAKLFNSKLQAGRYELTWDASQFSSGLYFIRIETSSFIDTKKMILIK